MLTDLVEVGKFAEEGRLHLGGRDPVAFDGAGGIDMGEGDPRSR